MDAEAVRRQRQSQLDEKRKRLEDLRKRRQEKTTTASVDVSSQSANAQSVPNTRTENVGDLDDFINNLLSTPAVPQVEEEDSKPTAPPPQGSNLAVTAESEASDVRQHKCTCQCRKEDSQPATSPPPPPPELYDKECQTDVIELEPEKLDGGPRSPHRASVLPINSQEHLEKTDGAQVQEQENLLQASTLTEEDKKTLLASDSFESFLRRASTLVERAMFETSTFDILSDYGGGSATVERKDSSGKLAHTLCFVDDARCAGRAVSDVHWSQHFPELLLAAYSAHSKGSEANGGDDGLVLVWSLALPSRPEFVLWAQSPVLCARFHDFDTRFVVGGTYTGQVVLWDLGAKSQPVQRTALSAAGHTHPVYSVAMEGNLSAHSLVTASTDGKILWWNRGQLSQPTEVLNLTRKAEGPASIAAAEWGARDVAVPVTCLSISNTEEQQFVLGTESGSIYMVDRRVRSNSTSVLEEYAGHCGMVTSIDLNPGTSKALKGLLLSSSVDWTSKLWNLGHSRQALLTFSHGTFDYVCDARWSPKRPAVFVTANVAGEIALWDLLHSTEEPLIPPTKVPPAKSSPASDRCALTKLAWSSDGRRIAVGDASGAVHLYSLTEDLASPRSDEELRLEVLIENYHVHE